MTLKQFNKDLAKCKEAFINNCNEYLKLSKSDINKIDIDFCGNYFCLYFENDTYTFKQEFSFDCRNDNDAKHCIITIFSRAYMCAYRRIYIRAHTC